MTHDPNDPEFRRQQYRQQMLGVNRPQQASKPIERMVDSLIQQAETCQSYREEGKRNSHHEAVLKDKRKALLRKIARMELAEEEFELLDSVFYQASLYLDLPGEDTQDDLAKAVSKLTEFRLKQMDRNG